MTFNGGQRLLSSVRKVTSTSRVSLVVSGKVCHRVAREMLRKRSPDPCGVADPAPGSQPGATCGSLAGGPELGVGLGPEGDDHFRCCPGVPVGDQDPFAEDLFFQAVSGRVVDVPAQPEGGWRVTGDGDRQDVPDPPLACDLVDGLAEFAVPPATAGAEHLGDLAEVAFGLGQGLVEAGE